MKNYKLLVPFVLTALFVLGVYMMGSSNAEEEEQYRQYLENAREYASQEIELYAVENYRKALEMHPSPGLYLEVAEFYQNIMGDYGRSVEWGERARRSYPKAPDAYEFLLGVHLEHRDYVSFFALYNDMKNRQVSSEMAEDLYAGAEYEYYFQGEYDEVSIFSGGLAPVRRNETWGYSTAKGKRKIGTMYTCVGAFNQGMAPVTDGEGKSFFIDADGNKVFVADTEDRVEALGVMSSAEIYAVYNGREWNYYNKAGDLVMGGFMEASTMANGLAACRTQAGWQIYDISGNLQINEIYEDIMADEKQVVYRNERLFVKKDGSWKMIDASGVQVGTDTYENAEIFYDDSYAAVNKGGKWGFIDKDGNWYIEPVYEDARSFSNGYAAVQMEGKWGFINMDKELCIPCQFADAKDFTSNGTVFVQRDSIWSVLLLYKNNY